MGRIAALLLFLPAVLAAQEKPPDEKKMKHTNRLAKEKSPYLLQHAHNPVDWYPWGPEAFEKAKKEGKPIFLSIGYSTCHWCHVMEKDSFEKDDVAEILNRDFVPIKVDREERPDVDQIYMAAVTAMNDGRGGWPLSAWLTPDLKPFTGGTYFPRERFKDLLGKITGVWKERRADVEADAENVAKFLKQRATAGLPGEVDAAKTTETAQRIVERSFEPSWGGFSSAPKFPHSTTVQFLLRRHLRTGSKEALVMVEKTLLEMARGGIYDQLGGGFHRYSTDAQWIVPHFEKMLYDNALLATAYLEAFQLTKKELYSRIARETLDYVLRDMTSKDGGFHSAEDADSEGVEGKFYVWNPAQVVEVLGEKDAERFMKAYDVTKEGNWDPHEESLPKHQSVLRLTGPEEFPDLERKLLEVRAKRVRPGLDDKVLTSWNGLMISAFCLGAQALDEPRYRDAAVKAGKFLLEKHRKDGRLLRTSRLGEAKLEGSVDDYAYLSAAMLDLYETTFDAAWYEEGARLAAKAVELFWDPKAGGFFYGMESPDLVARMREDHEGPMPTGNSVLALAFLRLHAFTGEEAHRERAVKTLESYQASLEQIPHAHAWLLCALDFLQGPAREVVIAGPSPEPLLRALRGGFYPNKVVAFADGKAKLPLLEGRGPVQGKATAYVCENRACKLPVTEPGKLLELLKP